MIPSATGTYLWVEPNSCSGCRAPPPATWSGPISS